ncbi:lung adenoma susceptibility protein 2 [Microcaecilia unicolor]|uniref:Lung adenoma susceptibility protein 2 n=1 Tax=Microcaecilia unicolor TaxID=1415580 RepID=A0A6P7XB96_9AMPH|nr:lung adenoma susceptibility protein 2 [Microcaecilia unicolor]XP_030047836.1 lung adenoma susceptibility protein 2 [Microcaecilia unicolor]XP_030047837.1 lung adenoma susceptibility protein 2 [Microcaecilia unicolor]
MAKLLKESAICSPESSISISSLLASCSLGSSQSSSRSLISSISYKEKLYESATEALEAYIKDYEGSLLSPSVSTGKICIQKTPVRNFHSRRKVSGNVDCAGDRQTFSSPFKSHMINDLDLASLTTDDLLAFPSDGSLPFHEASISKPMIQRNKQRWKNHKSSLKKYTSYSLFDFESEPGFQHNLSVLAKKNLAGFSPSKTDSSGTVEKPQHFSLEGNDGQTALKSLSSKNYPRWLTSQKSDLNVSGITSIPDVKYPMWLKNSGLLSDSVDKDFTSKFHTTADSSSEHIPYGLGNMTYLDNLDSSNIFDNNKHLHLDDVEGMNEMSVFQQEDLVTSSRSKKPFRDDMIELLILKAERALESSVKGVPSSMENFGSPQTEDVVEAERSWEKIPVTFKSPVPIFCDEGTETLQTTKLNLVNKESSNNDPQAEESTLSGGNHHGPVEALKQMLFNLQTVQQCYSHDKTEKEEMKKFSETESENLFDKEMMPVNKSLNKAMHHLSRLKKLVEDNSEERDQRNESLEKEVQSN